MPLFGQLHQRTPLVKELKMDGWHFTILQSSEITCEHKSMTMSLSYDICKYNVSVKVRLCGRMEGSNRGS